MRLGKTGKTRLLAALLCLLMLAGCGEGSKTPEKPKTEVTMMYFSRLPGFEALVESTFPDIDLKVEQNSSGTLDSESERRLSKGHGTDIIMTTLPDSEIGKYTYDLSAEEFMLSYSGAVNKLMLIGGRVHYIPLPGQYYGFVANKTLMKELGFDRLGSYDDVYKLLATAQSLGMGVGRNGDCLGFYNIGESYIANVIMGSYVPDFLSTEEGMIWTGELLQGKAKFTGNMEDSMSFLMHCAEKGYVDTGTVLSGESVTISNKNAVDVVARMEDRTMVLALGSTELYSKLKEGESTDEFEMIPYLSYKNAPGWFVGFGDGYLAINKALYDKGEIDKLDAALRILSLLSSEEGQLAWMADTDALFSYLKYGIGVSQEMPPNVLKLVEEGRIYEVSIPNNVMQYFGRQMIMAIRGKGSLAASMNAVDNYMRVGFDSITQARTIVGEVANDLIYENYNTRREETEIGNLIADAVREYTGADMALVNGGGIRSSLYEGEVWDADLDAVCPYGNKIITVKMSGATLKAALANGISQTDRGEQVPGGRFLQVSGLCYSYRPMQGEKGTAELISVTLQDGTPVKNDATYVVAITDYMAGAGGYADNNGDGYTMLNVYDGETPKTVTLLEESEATYRDALRAFFDARGAAVTVELEGRIKIVK